MLATKKQIESSSYNPNDGLLKVSKSSFMTYVKCPRQYWWRHIGLPDVRIPATPEMLRGTMVHETLEDLYEHYPKNGEQLLTNMVVEHEDIGVNALGEMESQRKEIWGAENFMPLEFEVKHHVYDKELDIVMVGKMDGLFRHPEGGLCIAELKTGNLNSSKLSRTRKELCFYARMLQLMGYDEVTHFMFMTPDCDNVDMLESLSNNKKKQVFTGLSQGLTLVEPISKSSLKAFEKSLYHTISNLKLRKWPMKWSEYFCMNWCDFHMACDNELNGLSDAPFAENEE